jgi:hypothetical protein
MPEVVLELQVYLGAQIPGQGLARRVLGGDWAFVSLAFWWEKVAVY